MSLTRRSFLGWFGIGTAVVVAAPQMALQDHPSELSVVQPQSHAVEVGPEEDEVSLRPSRPTRIETFLRSRGIKPAHLARESGYSRQHLLRVRMGRIEPDARCMAAVAYAVRRLSREYVRASDLFGSVAITAGIDRGPMW